MIQKWWLRDWDLPVIWTFMYVACLVWKPIVEWCLRFRYGRKAHIMYTMDYCQSELFDAPHHANHINPTFILEGQALKPKELRRKLEKMLDDEFTFGKLKLCKKLFLGYWVWIPARDVDLDNHIRFSDIRYDDRRHLARLLTELRDPEPCFPPDVSPWEIQVIYSADGTETAVNIHSDHSIMDGYALFQIFMPALAESFPSEAVQEPPAEPRLKSGLKAFLGRLSDGGDSSRHVRGNDPDVNPIKALVQENGLPGSLGLWSERIPVQRLKRIAKKWHTSINTVFLACYSAALDELMENISSSRDNNLKGKPRVSCISTYANWHKGCPWQLRNEFLATADDLPSRFSPAAAIMNNGAMSRPGAGQKLTLPARIRFLDDQKPDTRRRLEFAWAGLTAVMSVASFRWTRWMSNWGRGRGLASPFTTVHTNVVTYDVVIDVCGHRVKDIVGFMPKIFGLGPASLLFSYNGNAVFGIVADACLFSSQDEIAKFIVDVTNGFAWLENN